MRLLPFLLLACSALASGAESSTPLLEAAYQGDAARVAELIRGGADVKEANIFGATPMAQAAQRGDTAVLKLLLKAGADPESANAEGETALMIVARTGNVEAAKVLVAAGAKIDTREKWGGQTALLWAAAQNQPEMIRFLVSKGAEVDARSAVRDWWGQTPLYMAVDMNTLPTGARTELPTMDQATGMDLIHLLIGKGANVNARLKLRPPYRNVGQDRLADPAIDYGATPLLRAAKAADLPAMKALLDAGALVDLPNGLGHTPLIVAAGATRGRATPTRGGNYTEEQAIAAVKMLLA